MSIPTALLGVGELGQPQLPDEVVEERGGAGEGGLEGGQVLDGESRLDGAVEPSVW